GFLLELSFKIFAVVKVYKILQALFESGAGIKAFQAQIPLLNVSLNQLISNMAGTQVQITSLSGLTKAATLTMKRGFEQLSQAIFKTTATNILSLTALRG